MRLHTLYTLLAGVILLCSCRVSKNISTARVNTDSLVTHVKDSMSVVHTRETSELKRMLEEMTTSGVTFVVDSCPERDAVLALLDSAGRANYEKAILESRVKSLSNKVTISERGAITAEGQIKAAYFTNSKLQEELFRTEKTVDQLTKENDSLRAQKSTVAESKIKDVERKPVFGGYAMAFGLGALAMFLFLLWVNKKRSLKNISMKKTSLMLLIAGAMMFTGCDSHDKPTDNISFGQAWGAAAGFGSYWIWLVIALAVAGVASYFLFKDYRKTQDWSGGKTTIVVVLLAIILVALLYPPAEIAANTTVEQASRGVYIR